MTNRNFVSKNELDNTVPAENQLKDVGAVLFEGEGGFKVLFIGNSITWHGYRSEIGRFGDYGMVASARETDYVHALSSMLRKKYGKVSTCIAQLAEWERNYESDTILEEKYAAARDFGADIIVVRIGENMAIGRFEHHGVSVHPSDKGMKLIAERIFRKIEV